MSSNAESLTTHKFMTALRENVDHLYSGASAVSNDSSSFDCFKADGELRFNVSVKQQSIIIYYAKPFDDYWAELKNISFADGVYRGDFVCVDPFYMKSYSAPFEIAESAPWPIHGLMGRVCYDYSRDEKRKPEPVPASLAAMMMKQSSRK